MRDRAFNLGEFKDGKAQQPLPDSFVDHEVELNEFQYLCHKLCLRLLRLFAIALNVSTQSIHSQPVQLIKCFSRLIPQKVVQSGSHPVTRALLVPREPYFGCFTTQPWLPVITHLISISVLELTATTEGTSLPQILSPSVPTLANTSQYNPPIPASLRAWP